jgi:glutamate dehydrogenase
LDLLIPGQSPGIKERLVDLYNKPEILFFGPDGAQIRVVLSF